MPSIAVIGPGAIGGTLAAWLLNKPGNDVCICARSPFKTLRVEAPGQTLEFTPRVHVSPENAAAVDWVILATKTYQVAEAAGWLPQLIKAGTRVAVVQNGVEHIANVSAHVDSGSVVPVIIDCPAERMGPGELLQRDGIYMAVPSGDNSSDFAALFDDPNIEVDITQDWTTAAWRKLCINSSGAISALTKQSPNIAGQPNAANVMRCIIDECVAVGRAEGATLPDSIADEIISALSKKPGGSMNSIHADIVAERPMEWDARNGVIARLGQKHGISTPYNRMAADVLAAIESTYSVA